MPYFRNIIVVVLLKQKNLRLLSSWFLFRSTLEHGLQSTLAHPPTINNNNSSINNNNHNTKSGTNASKFVANDDHYQPLIAKIHRNGKSSGAVVVANKAVAVPQHKAKPTGKSSLSNGELNDDLIEFSIIDLTDGNTTLLAADKATRNSKQQPTATDLNIIHANNTIVALSILIQHLTTDVSAFFRIGIYMNCSIIIWIIE